MKYLLLFFITFNVLCAETKWRVNKDHSEIFFKVPYLTVSEVTGRFTKFKGRIFFDDDLVLANKIQLSIQSDSINTANDLRDKHIKSKSFLKVNQFPEITFTSTNIKPIAPDTFVATGKLTILNKTKEITLKYTLSEAITDTWGYVSKFAKFETSINRKDFEINWDKAIKDNKLLVGNEIKIFGTLQIQPLRFSTPASKHTIPNTKYTRNKEKLIRGEISQEEFDNQITDTAPLKAKEIKTITQSEPTQSYAPMSQRGQKDKTVLWWLAFSIMGFLGFFAMIIVILQGKYLFMRLWPKYEETGLAGNVADFVIYPIAFIYAWALWYLGYAI